MAPDTDPIVITGMGAVSPLGIGVEANWRALMEGKSGIVMNDRFDVTEFAAKIAGLVPKGFDPTTVRGSSGISGLADRLAADGGNLDVNSAPGSGTRLTAMMPAGT